MLARAAISAVLTKISKHLALLVCLLILGRATGSYPVSQIAIFGTAAVSSLLYLAGRALEDRLSQEPGLQGGRM